MDEQAVDNKVVLREGLSWDELPVCRVRRMVDVDQLVELLRGLRQKWVTVNNHEEVWASEIFADVIETIEDGLR